MSTSVADTAMDTVALKLLPTWTAICTFIGFSNWVQSQHRCATAMRRWPCFCGVRGWRPFGGFSFPHNGALASAPGTAHRGLAAAVGSQFFTVAPRDGASHSGEAGVRVFEPGECRAIQIRGEHARCVFAMSNV